MKLIYLGSGAFGLPTLQKLAHEHTLLAVVSQPDRPAGRGMKLTPTPVAAWATSNLPNVPLLNPDDINEPRVRDRLRALHADAWVVIAFGQKLGAELLRDIFAINLHASLLPRWRGAAPINAAILAGDDDTGNSVITLADRMDAGLILGQSRRAIDPLVTAGELHDLLANDGPDLVMRVLNEHRDGSLHPVTQNESLVTKARKLAKADGTLDFTLPARTLRCRVHGLTPWPGVTITVDTLPVKLLRVAETAAPLSLPPGTLDSDAGIIAADDGTALKLLDVQPSGGTPMPWHDLRRGRGNKWPARVTLSV